MKNEKLCPLINKTCLGKYCQWWFVPPEMRMLADVDVDYEWLGDCSVTLIAEQLRSQ